MSFSSIPESVASTRTKTQPAVFDVRRLLGECYAVSVIAFVGATFMFWGGSIYGPYLGLSLISGSFVVLVSPIAFANARKRNSIYGMLSTSLGLSIFLGIAFCIFLTPLASFLSASYYYEIVFAAVASLAGAGLVLVESFAEVYVPKTEKLGCGKHA